MKKIAVKKSKECGEVAGISLRNIVIIRQVKTGKTFPAKVDYITDFAVKFRLVEIEGNSFEGFEAVERDGDESLWIRHQDFIQDFDDVQLPDYKVIELLNAN